MIEVERINTFFKTATAKPLFQEVLTARCAKTLGARVTSTGWHSGVKVTCEVNP